ATNKGGSASADSSEVTPAQAPGVAPAGIDGADGADGTDGTAGLNGADGAAGPQGVKGLTGATGAKGADGRDAKVTCKGSGTKKQKVTCKVTLAARNATLTRNGRVYARGTAKSLRATRTVTRGTYTLRAGKTSVEVRVTG